MGRDAAPAPLSSAGACPPWPDTFPEGLAGWGESCLLRPLGLDRAGYGTARMVERDAEAPRKVVGSLNVGRAGVDGSMLVEVLPQATAEAFAEAGLRFADDDVARSPAALETLQDAMDRYLCRMPGLAASVASLARILHVMLAEGDDYDTSHSEPDLPFSIFVSVPDPGRPDARLRVVESIVHETMHLQLTLVERRVPLLDASAPPARSFSPWRGTMRDAAGVLHALYVFRVIERFWASVAAHDPDPAAVRFATRRREEIAGQVAEVADFRHCPALTPSGRSLVGHLLGEPRP